MIRKTFWLAAAALLAGVVAAAGAEAPVDHKLSAEAQKLPAGTNVAVMEVEGRGVVEIRMLDAETPKTAANFEKLVADKFYDGIPFHRVVADFVIQAGDATLVGRPEPDLTLDVEPDQHKCVRGAMSMARGGYYDDAGNMVYADTSPTQFFILMSDKPHLDDNFCVFGLVVAGMDVVDKVAQGDVIKSIRMVKVGE